MGGLQVHDIIAALLGRGQAQTTQRYAQLFDNPPWRATARVGAVVTAAGGVDGRADVGIDPIERPRARHVAPLIYKF